MKQPSTSKKQYPTSHLVSFKRIDLDTPLGELYNNLLKTPAIKRMALYAKFLDQFHLKNSVTMCASGREVEINGRRLINFGSCNYLGLDQHPALIEAGGRGAKEFGAHSGISRMFSSHANLICLEEEVSQLVHAERSRVFANLAHVHMGVIPVLFGNSDATIFLDKYAHATMHQSSLTAKAKGANIVRCDIGRLNETENLLIKCGTRVKVLLIDGIYSMQGNLPPIPDIQKTCDKHGCILYVDDAHGIGVLGENGGGAVEHFGLSYENMILTGSLQKGLGAFGGFVSGLKGIIEVIMASSTSFIFSGAIQPQSVEQGRAAIAISSSDEGRKLRQRLREKSIYLRQQLQMMGFDAPKGDSPIIPVTIGSDLRTLMAGRKMFDEGIYLSSVAFPAVPRNQGILRLSLTAINTDEQIDLVLKAFRNLKRFLDDHQSWTSNIRFAKEIVSANFKGDSYAGLS